MATSIDLDALESELKTSMDFEGKKRDAASIAKAYFLERKGRDPTDDEMNEHFLQKWHSKIAVDLSNRPISDLYSVNDLEESFFDLISHALYSRFKQDSDVSNSHFSKAKKIANILNNSFITNQYDYAIKLDSAALKKKLKTDRCYELVNQTVANDRNRGIALIGTGLSLADSNNDTKRLLDLHAKCQYVLYEIENCPHVAMSLGKYLLSESPNYHALAGWTHFHNGNIWLDLENPQAAKEEFEGGIEWAIQAGFPYAQMTLYERLGLACKNLNKLNLAQQHYEDSLTIGATEEIKPWLVSKNEVRCYIGLGLIQYETALNPSGSGQDATSQLAEDYFKRALEIANQVNYVANQAAALSSLGDLQRLKAGDTDPDAKRYHKLAYQIKTETLGLDPTLIKRVKHDKDHM
ncbi:hypothetical protein GWO43_05510 [candidate division KSB1 bacterium]|nr:hypothetical protein [candidate division KSB1 bacterium]NIR71607.1 hypothetical protein [candidate division KSB1 bacterium]NIS23442.1 hypothetical protein [candidate division KSB1 bacterium]NIT70350.1 hypothetical protein [candidate division KSB1 bacterium]NIU24052.1 hypothetical protein [candidate division KSB1 bacterium]